jgi:hypothetical protein
MDAATGFSAAVISDKITLYAPRSRREMQAAAAALVRRYPEVGAGVLACMHMPPYADALRQTTDLPVFDAATMVK